jgi:ATP-dependent Clp protease ATP-binding subunit ClpX
MSASPFRVSNHPSSVFVEVLCRVLGRLFRLVSRYFSYPIMLAVPSRSSPHHVLVAYRCTRSLHSTAAAFSSSSDFRSSFSGSGFTGYYEQSDTEGPLRKASNIGAPKITPRALKKHLDQFVVGQERAKKVLSSTIYNHYQRIQEIDRQHEEAQELLERQARRSRHPVEG